MELQVSVWTWAQHSPLLGLRRGSFHLYHLSHCSFTDKVTVLESFSSVVRVAVETSEFQVEVELAPTVEIPTCWPEKARWPRCLKRWPSQEKVQCIKVSSIKTAVKSVQKFPLQVCDSGSEGCREDIFQIIWILWRISSLNDGEFYGGKTDWTAHCMSFLQIALAI